VITKKFDQPKRRSLLKTIQFWVICLWNLCTAPSR